LGEFEKVPFNILDIIDVIFTLLYIFILVRIVLSFIPIPVNHVTRPILNFVYDITEPILRLVRNVIPPISLGGVGLDLSPLIAIILLRIIRHIIYAVIGLV